MTNLASKQELMIVLASRIFRDGEIAFIGIGAPNLAANLAKRTHAPNLVIVYETGIVGAKPFKMPLSVGDACITSNSQCLLGAFEIFTWMLQAGRVDTGFLGGAQVDRWGNLNSSVIGKYENPQIRMPGSGGAADVASMANRTVIIMPHERRRFPQNIDFITSPGYVGGRFGRRKLGLTGGGPEVVITDLGVLGFDVTGEMELRELHSGIRLEEVYAQTGWDLKVSQDLGCTKPPTPDELEILRALQLEQMSN